MLMLCFWITRPRAVKSVAKTHVMRPNQIVDIGTRRRPDLRAHICSFVTGRYRSDFPKKLFLFKTHLWLNIHQFRS